MKLKILSTLALLAIVAVVFSQQVYGPYNPNGPSIVAVGGGSGSGSGVDSNTVYSMIQTYGPTNSGINASQAATQINDTNVNRIQPVVDAKTNALYGTLLSQINTSSNSVVTNLPPRANYPAFTNTTTGVLGNVLMTTTHLDTNGSTASIWTNLQPFQLEFHILTNAFTNVVTCEIGPLTNKDGYVFYLFGGTNQ